MKMEQWGKILEVVRKQNGQDRLEDWTIIVRQREFSLPAACPEITKQRHVVNYTGL